MSGVAYTHRMWTATRGVLAAHTRTHFHLTMGAHRLTQSLTKTLNAWHTTMLGFRFWFRHSVAHTSLAMREQLAHLYTWGPGGHTVTLPSRPLTPQVLGSRTAVKRRCWTARPLGLQIREKGSCRAFYRQTPLFLVLCGSAQQCAKGG